MYLKIRLQWLEKLKVATQRTFIAAVKMKSPPRRSLNYCQRAAFMFGGGGRFLPTLVPVLTICDIKLLKTAFMPFHLPHIFYVYVLKTRYFINEFSWKKQSTVLLGFNQVTDPPKQYFWKRYVKLQLQRTVNRKRNLFLTKYYAK